jgi:hypothetical protein
MCAWHRCFGASAFRQRFVLLVLGYFVSQQQPYNRCGFPVTLGSSTGREVGEIWRKLEVGIGVLPVGFAVSVLFFINVLSSVI